MLSGGIFVAGRCGDSKSAAVSVATTGALSTFPPTSAAQAFTHPPNRCLYVVYE